MEEQVSEKNAEDYGKAIAVTIPKPDWMSDAMFQSLPDDLVEPLFPLPTFQVSEEAKQDDIYSKWITPAPAKPKHTEGDSIAEEARDLARESFEHTCHSCFDPIATGAPRVNVPVPSPMHPSCAERERRKK